MTNTLRPEYPPVRLKTVFELETKCWWRTSKFSGTVNKAERLLDARPHFDNAMSFSYAAAQTHAAVVPIVNLLCNVMLPRGSDCAVKSEVCNISCQGTLQTASRSGVLSGVLHNTRTKDFIRYDAVNVWPSYQLSYNRASGCIPSSFGIRLEKCLAEHHAMSRAHVAKAALHRRGKI